MKVNVLMESTDQRVIDDTVQQFHRKLLPLLIFQLLCTTLTLVVLIWVPSIYRLVCEDVCNEFTFVSCSRWFINIVLFGALLPLSLSMANVYPYSIILFIFYSMFQAADIALAIAPFAWRITGLYSLILATLSLVAMQIFTSTPGQRLDLWGLTYVMAFPCLLGGALLAFVDVKLAYAIPVGFLVVSMITFCMIAVQKECYPEEAIRASLFVMCPEALVIRIALSKVRCVCSAIDRDEVYKSECLQV
eukprot:CFRG6175T1